MLHQQQEQLAKQLADQLESKQSAVTQANKNAVAPAKRNDNNKKYSRNPRLGGNHNTAEDVPESHRELRLETDPPQAYQKP